MLFLLLGLSAATPAHAASAPRGVLPDSLSQPAVASRLAEHALLSDVARAGRRLVTVGIRGHILYSDDEGASWRQAQVPVSVTLTGLCFADDRHGWAVGHRGVILATGDAGQSWTLQMDGQAAAAALLAEASDRQSALLDSAQMLVDDGADKPFLDIQCLGPRQAVAVGAYGLAFRTTNGGQRWQPSLEAMAGSDQRHLNALASAPGGLYLAGEQGGLYRADTALTGFETLAEPYEGSFFGLTTTAEGALLAYGLRGHVFRWQGGAADWQQVPLPTTQSVTAGTLLADGSVLLADASGKGWFSQDAGRSFIQVQPQRQYSFTALTPLEDGSVLAVGLRGVTRFQAAELEQPGISR